MDEYISIFISELLESGEQLANTRRQQRTYPAVDIYDLSETEVIKNFRLNKDLIRVLIDLLAPVIQDTTKIDLKTKVLCTLHFLGTGSYQTPTGNLNKINVSQATTSRCISDVVEALNHPNIFHEWVRFPRTLQELQTIALDFYNCYGFPGVIGCIDCTHVAIVPPPGTTHDERSYVNRKNFHSINTQLICDSKLKILNVNALFPGSTHDSYIWSNSAVLPLLHNLHNAGYTNYHLLAHGFSLNTHDVIFQLFTWNNAQTSEPLLAEANSIMVSQYFRPNRPTIICIHSQDDNAGGNFIAFMHAAHLLQDVNLVAVDWSVGAGMYSSALGNAPQVGHIIAQFINILASDFGYNPSNIKLVGVGLGAHIAGIAGRNANGNVPHIVALDPSFHGWTHHPEILRASDANLVEVLHTTVGNYGYDYPLGDLDFYPNGGTNQAGCGADVSCSHTYSYAFYAESLTSEVNGGNRFVGTGCATYEEAVTGQCSGTNTAIFGGTTDRTGITGIYYFTTNVTPPFASG